MFCFSLTIKISDGLCINGFLWMKVVKMLVKYVMEVKMEVVMELVLFHSSHSLRGIDYVHYMNIRNWARMDN